MQHSVFVEVRGQLKRVGSLLLPHGFLGLNSDHQACQKVPLPTEPSHWSHIIVIIIIIIINIIIFTLVFIIICFCFPLVWNLWPHSLVLWIFCLSDMKYVSWQTRVTLTTAWYIWFKMPVAHKMSDWNFLPPSRYWEMEPSMGLMSFS